MAELLGLSHEFNFEGYKIKISLPTNEQIAENCWSEDDEVVLLGWKNENDIKTALSAEIRFVNVKVYVREKIHLSDDELEKGFLKRKIYSEPQKKLLYSLSEKYNDVVKRAFDLWVRTLRWKCWSSQIGRPEIFDNETGLVFLTDDNTDKRFWRFQPEVTLGLEEVINLFEWKETESALKNKTIPPIFIDLFFDAQEHQKIKDFQRVTIDLAVACETLMRSTVIESLPKKLSGTIKKFIDEANIRQVVTKFFPDLLSDEKKTRFKKIESSLHKLFDERNKILHSGYSYDASEKQCEKFFTTTVELFSVMNNLVCDEYGEEKKSRIKQVVVVNFG